MVGTITVSKEAGTHKPLVTGSNPVAATSGFIYPADYGMRIPVSIESSLNTSFCASSILS
jgi:hypothetical protein